MDWYKIKYDEMQVIAANVSFEGQEVKRTRSFSVKDGKVLFVYANGMGIRPNGRVCYVDKIKSIEWIAETAVVELLENSGFMLEDGIIKKKPSVDWGNIKFGKGVYIMDTIYADECDIEVVPIEVRDNEFVYVHASYGINLIIGYMNVKEVKSLTEVK